MVSVEEIKAREVLDSRGFPTLEVDAKLKGGAWGRAMVPSGKSKGSHEAVELRDCDQSRFNGRGVLQAMRNVNNEIARHIVGMPGLDQSSIDQAMIDLDGTSDKANLGANAILGVSMAVARAAACHQSLSLFEYLDTGEHSILPVPMFNILNGGKHAAHSTDFQEFMVVPVGADTFCQAIRMGSEIYHKLGQLLEKKGLSTNVGDEGGFAPSLSSNRDAMELLVQSIELAGYKPGKECFLALDSAATELFDQTSYVLSREQIELSPRSMTEYYVRCSIDYPIISIEDGLAEDDWEGWELLNFKVGDRVQIVGDDLYVTNLDRLNLGIKQNASNAILIKPNQVGTITETLEVIRVAKEAGWGTIVSHRSGETEDTIIADLALATGAAQIKSGAPARSERVAKYNRLIRIEEYLGSRAQYAGKQAFSHVIQL